MRYLALLLLFVGGSALAQAAPGSEASVSSDYLLRLVLGLAFIVALIFVLARFATRFNLNHGAGNGALKIIAGLPTGARDRIVLLQVGEEQILLGLTPGRIEKLHSLTVPIDTDEETVVTGNFARKLKSVIDGSKAS